MSAQPTTLRDALALWYGKGDYAAALAAIREKVADGTFLSVIAREVHERATREGIADQIATSRPALSRLLNETEDGKQLVRDARAEGGHALAEKAVQVAEECPADRDEVQRARLRVETLRWAAGKMNPEYDDKPSTMIGIQSDGALFLQAVARPGPGAVPPPRPTPKEIVVTPAPELPPAKTTAQKITADSERAAYEKRVHEVAAEIVLELGYPLPEARQLAALFVRRELPAPTNVKIVKDDDEELE